MNMEKYKWYILGYVFYASIVLASIWNERRDFWPLLIIWCITIPVALYIIWALVSKYRKAQKSKINNTTAVEKNLVKKSDDSANNDSNSDLVKSWPLVDFAKEHGKMQIGEFTNGITGKSFKSCIFTGKDDTTLYVSFYSKLGVLTPQQIKEKRDSLKVGLLNTNKYVLYEVWEGWDKVNLGI